MTGSGGSTGSAPRCLIRGGGDLATGVAWRLTRAGWPVVVCELPRPLTVRRTVALSSAVLDGRIDVEGMIGRRIDIANGIADGVADRADGAAAGVADEANGADVEHLVTRVTDEGEVAVLVSPELPSGLEADVVVDARLAKRNLDTTLDDAALVVALGPGFTAGVDCHAVVETLRGHHLGRVLWRGSAAADTGVPGSVGGRGAERVLRAPVSGRARWRVAIGDRVMADQALGSIGDHPVVAPFDGVVRGLIAESVEVPAGLKIGDVDPRADPAACHEISDKALAVGGGVVEAVLTWLAARGRA